MVIPNDPVVKKHPAGPGRPKKKKRDRAGPGRGHKKPPTQEVEEGIFDDQGGVEQEATAAIEIIDDDDDGEQEEDAEEAAESEDSRSTIYDDDDAPALSDSCEFDNEDWMTLLEHIKDKTLKAEEKMKQELISSAAAEINSKFDELRSKLTKDRQNIVKALSKGLEQCEKLLNQSTDFPSMYQSFCEDKISYLQAQKDTESKCKKEMERLYLKFQQHLKEEEKMLAEHEIVRAKLISGLEDSLKKIKLGNKTTSFLKKSLDCFLDVAFDEDFTVAD